MIFAADAGALRIRFFRKRQCRLPHYYRCIPSTAILQVYWGVQGAGIPGGAFIVSVDSPNQVTISSPANATTRGDATSWGKGIVQQLPTELFDFDPRTSMIRQVTLALPDANLPYEGSYPTRMLILPTGQLLFSDDSSQLWVYTSSGKPNPRLRPIITKVSYLGDRKFRLRGFQLDGPSTCGRRLRRRRPDGLQLSDHSHGEPKRQCLLRPERRTGARSPWVVALDARPSTLR